jgi:hypothetical protein
MILTCRPSSLNSYWLNVNVIYVVSCVLLLLLCVLQRMLLEAAVYGAVLFGVEQRLDREYGYKLSARKDREEQAGLPPM